MGTRLTLVAIGNMMNRKTAGPRGITIGPRLTILLGNDQELARSIVAG